MSETIVFFGNERIATGVQTDTPVLRSLLAEGYRIAAVVANYERGNSRNVRDLEIAAVAKAHDIPLLLPGKLSDIADELRDLHATAAVLVAYGKIIPQSIIDIFPKGIINIHPSLLPKHRGPTPIESVILDGSRKTGVSVMQLAKAMDAGPIYGQSEYALTGQESKQALSDILLDISCAMLKYLLPGILSDELIALPQDESAATYDKLISKDDGVIDWQKPAVQLEREVRAFLEWPKSRAHIGALDVIITEARAVKSLQASSPPGAIEAAQDGVLIIKTGDGSLFIDRLKPAGKQAMDVKAFLNGYGAQLGIER